MSDMFKGMSAREMANKVIKSGVSDDSPEFIRDIATGPDAKAAMKSYVESEDYLYLFNPNMNKGGMVKSRTGTQDFRKGGMVLATVDRRKKK